MLDEGSELLWRGVAGEFYVIGDRIGERRIASEVAPDSNANRIEADTACRRLPEEIIRDAAADREIEELAPVEPESASTAVCWPVNDQRLRASTSDRGRLAGDVTKLHFNGHAPDHLDVRSPGQGGQGGWLVPRA